MDDLPQTSRPPRTLGAATTTRKTTTGIMIRGIRMARTIAKPETTGTTIRQREPAVAKGHPGNSERPGPVGLGLFLSRSHEYLERLPVASML